MRCLNCNTVVADTDPVCLACGAKCTTPVREDQSGIPVPFIGISLMIAGVFGYALTTTPTKDRDAIEDKKTTAYIWGLAGFFLGLMGDAYLWSRARRNRPASQGGDPGVAVFDTGTANEPIRPLGPEKQSAQPAAPAPAGLRNLVQQKAPPLPRPAQPPLVVRRPGAVVLSTAVSRPPVPAAGEWERPGEPRNGLVRGLFGLMWVLIFIFVTALVSSLIATAGAGDDEQLRKRLAEESGRTVGPWLLLASIILGIVLSKVGLLPGTRKYKR
jgi:hypothetical protein